MKNMKDYREEQGLTQADLAQMSGVSIRTIQALEKGERSIGDAKLKTLLPIARALGIAVEQLPGAILEIDDKLLLESDFEWFQPKETVE